MPFSVLLFLFPPLSHIATHACTDASQLNDLIHSLFLVILPEPFPFQLYLPQFYFIQTPVQFIHPCLLACLQEPYYISLFLLFIDLSIHLRLLLYQGDDRSIFVAVDDDDDQRNIEI